MTSPRKIAANRANARASTGPKTRHGRARSAKNALRHGLSVPIQPQAAFHEEARALANRIAGPGVSADIDLLTLRVAEAQIDLGRVRAARQMYLSQRLSNAELESSTIGSDLTEGLLRMDRYERRARSRLKLAIRYLDAARPMIGK